MYLAGAAPLPGEYRFLPLDELVRELPAGPRGARPARRRLRERAPHRPRARRCIERAPLVINVDHHHDNTRFGDVNLIVDDASSTAEIVRDLLGELDVSLTPEIAEALYVGLVTDTGRFQYTNTTPKALRLAAELVEAGADVHGIFRHVYETVQFAKLKLLARALERAQLLEGGRLVVSYLLRDDFAEVGAEEPYSEGIIDSLRAVEGSEMVALIREPPRERRPGAPHLASLEPRRGRRVGDRAPGRRRRPSPGRRLLVRGVDRGDHRVPAARVRPRDGADGSSAMPPRALKPVGSRCVDKPAGPSSFALVAALRRRTRRAPATPGRSIRSRRGCWCCCPARQLDWLHASSVWTSATSPTST